MKDRTEILETLSNILVDTFEVDRSSITLQASLYEDLDIDSIDAVDLILELKAITGKKVDPDDFKTVRTVDDVVSTVASMLGIG